MKIRLTPSDRKILEEIRAKIENTHWVKGTYYRVVKSGKNKGKPQYCMVGFVNAATLPEGYAHEGRYHLHATPSGTSSLKVKQRERILTRMRQELIEGGCLDSIQGFNDARKTQRSDVLNIIDRCLGKKS